MQNQLDEINDRLSNHFKKFFKDDTLEISAGHSDKHGTFKPTISVCINEKRYTFNTTYSVSIDNLFEICKIHSLDPMNELITRFEYEFPKVYEKELLEIKLDLLTE